MVRLSPKQARPSQGWESLSIFARGIRRGPKRLLAGEELLHLVFVDDLLLKGNFARFRVFD